MTPKEVATNWFACIDKRDFDGVRTLLAEGHTFHNPMTPVPIGVEEHIGMVQQMTSSWDGEHHLDHVLQEGNYVTVVGRWSGKHIGEFNGVPATGKHVEFSWIDVLEVVDGKINNEFFEMNPMSIMAQLGVMENA